MLSQTCSLTVEHRDQIELKYMSEIVTLQPPWVAVKRANRATAVVGLPHNFPVSKVSQTVTNQWN